MKDYIKNAMAIIGKQINAAKRMLCKLSRPVD